MLVSILIPCYNAERWIAQAVESALAQTWADKEVIVVDDGSTDGSADIVRGFGDAVVFEAAPHLGGNYARNRLLSRARGQWLQYLDADDYLLPDKIGNQIAFLASHQDADVVYGPVAVEYADGRAEGLEVLRIPEPRDLWVLLALWYLPQTGAPLWRKQAIVDVGGWDEQQRVCQEHDLYLRLLMAGKRFAYCEANGAVWRVWGVSSVSTGNRPEVRKRRLEIEQAAEDFLRARGRLTTARHAAVNQARFGMARVAWREGDREGARQVLAALHRSAPGFEPTSEPLLYRLMWKGLGFSATETMAGWRRTLISRPGEAR